MPHSTLTKKIEFSASHRYFQMGWDEEKNLQVFGPCVQEHGHNYLLEVTLGGRVDAMTGMIINLYDLKTIVTEVLEEFDHKHLNLDTPYFAEVIPTTENFALVLWRKFRYRNETRDISKLTLFEGEDLWAEVVTPPGDSPSEEPTTTSVSRRYHFSIFHRLASGLTNGRHLTLTVTTQGPIHIQTGRVTDIAVLDNLVYHHVIQPLEGKEISRNSIWGQKPLTLENLAQIIWPRISPLSWGRLHRLTLQDQTQTIVEFGEAG